MSEAGKGSKQRPCDKKKFDESGFWTRPAHVCKSCRVKIKKGENHFCPAEGWYEVSPGRWRCGETGRNHDSKNFLAKQHGCAPHQSPEFNKRYGKWGKWDNKGVRTFRDAHSLTGFRKAFGYPVY